MNDLSFRAAEVTKIKKTGDTGYLVSLRSDGRTAKINVRVGSDAPQAIEQKLPLPTNQVIIEALHLCFEEITRSQRVDMHVMAYLEHITGSRLDKFPKVVMVAEKEREKPASRATKGHLRVAGGTDEVDHVFRPATSRELFQFIHDHCLPPAP